MSFPPAPPITPPVPSAGEPPLWAPYYGASLGVAFSRFWKKYATFSGRASRSEFWWWELIYFIYVIILEIALVSTGAGVAVAASNGTVAFSPASYVVLAVVWITSLGTLIPTLALAWRRLHDTNRSGGYYFLGFIPLVGGIILIVFFASASDPAGARFDQPHA